MPYIPAGDMIRCTFTLSFEVSGLATSAPSTPLFHAIIQAILLLLHRQQLPSMYPNRHSLHTLKLWALAVCGDSLGDTGAGSAVGGGVTVTSTHMRIMPSAVRVRSAG